MIIATFDVGTTALKAVLINHEKEILFQHSLPINTLFEDEHIEQDPNHWYDIFCLITQQIWQAGFLPRDISAIIMSGQMQDFIPVDKEGNALRKAILYSDVRAYNEATWINQQVDKQTLLTIIGNTLDGSLPIAKLRWYQLNEPQNYANTAAILISAKDYIINKLTRHFVSDYTSASTFGLMDIKQKKWSIELINKLLIKDSLLPQLLASHQQAGTVQIDAAQLSGFNVGTPVYAGCGDAGASTFASGINNTNEYSIYLGTTGWIATISDSILSQQGIFNLVAISNQNYINVIPFLNAGNVHQWITKILTNELTDQSYQQINQLLNDSLIGSNELLFLPYIIGERFPVVDNHIKGTFIGINQKTTRADMVRACLEGVAFSIRSGFDAICTQPPVKITIIGGGTMVSQWPQILADILNSEIIVLNDATYLPSIALASSVLIDKKITSSYDESITQLLCSSNITHYCPNTESVLILEPQYQRFKKIYPAMKDICK